MFYFVCMKQMLFAVLVDTLDQEAKLFFHPKKKVNFTFFCPETGKIVVSKE